MSAPVLSVVVNFHDMAREAPRTLHTLSAGYQQGVDAAEYEVIAVDNGSRQPLDAALVRACGPNFRLLALPPGQVSPAAAINAAVRESAGSVVAVCIDGARMLSPGIVRLMLAAFRAFPDPVVATLGWHLGPKTQNQSMVDGYGRAVEDRLLESVDWRRDGYQLFTVSSFAASSAPGWFLPIAESNAIALRRTAYDRLGGFDERFRLEGGGLVCLDFYKRACETIGNLVLLLGEGTFHQFHGGVATNVPMAQHPGARFSDEYLQLRGQPFTAPTTAAHFLGTVPPQCLPFLAASVQQAAALPSKEPPG